MNWQNGTKNGFGRRPSCFCMVNLVSKRQGNPAYHIRYQYITNIGPFLGFGDITVEFVVSVRNNNEWFFISKGSIKGVVDVQKKYNKM